MPELVYSKELKDECQRCVRRALSDKHLFLNPHGTDKKADVELLIGRAGRSVLPYTDPRGNNWRLVPLTLESPNAAIFQIGLRAIFLPTPQPGAGTKIRIERVLSEAAVILLLQRRSLTPLLRCEWQSTNRGAHPHPHWHVYGSLSDEAPNPFVNDTIETRWAENLKSMHFAAASSWHEGAQGPTSIQKEFEGHSGLGSWFEGVIGHLISQLPLAGDLCGEKQSRF